MENVTHGGPTPEEATLQESENSSIIVNSSELRSELDVTKLDIDHEKRIINQLRTECYQVKDCFTRHSFQAIAASGALLILIARFQTQSFEVGLLSIIPIVLLFTVLDMGLHKYATSNRLNGYELYLNTIQYYCKEDEFRSRLLCVGWEEAMRAWRTVNTSLLHNLYKREWEWEWEWECATLRKWSWLATITAKLGAAPDRACRLKLKWPYAFTALKRIKNGPVWYCPKELLPPDGGGENHLPPSLVYSSGAYLRSLANISFILIFMCIFDVYATAYHIIYYAGLMAVISVSVFSVVVTVLVTGRILHVISRIKILENELQSIHACSIVWETTVVAHFLAIEKTRALNPSQAMGGYCNSYMELLGTVTQEVIAQKDDIPTWNKCAREQLHTLLVAATA